MMRREQLLEQYEDARFALMMDKFSEIEGKRLLEENERLNADPDFIVPPEVDRRSLRTISRYCSRKALRCARHKLAKALSKAAVAVLVGVLLFTTAFAVSDEFRSQALNWVGEVFSDRTEFSFVEPEPDGSAEGVGYTITVGWLPDGYALSESKETAFGIRNSYQSIDGSEFFIDTFEGTNATLGVDTENADVQSIKIQDEEALLVTKENVVQITWANKSCQIIVLISGTTSQTEELVEVAQNMLIVKG